VGDTNVVCITVFSIKDYIFNANFYMKPIYKVLVAVAVIFGGAYIGYVFFFSPKCVADKAMKDIRNGDLIGKTTFKDYISNELLSSLVAEGLNDDYDYAAHSRLEAELFQIPTSVRDFRFLRKSVMKETLHHCQDLQKMYHLLDEKQSFDDFVVSQKQIYSSSKGFTYNDTTKTICYQEEPIDIYSFVYLAETPLTDYQVDIRVLKSFDGYKVVAIFASPK
jgi:hypothetical protein